MTEGPGAPPNWYSTGVPGEYRWWDGRQWTSHVTSAPSTSSPLPAAPIDIRSRTVASWILALAPLTLAVVLAVLVGFDAELWIPWTVASLSWAVMVPLAIGLGLWDLSALRSRGSGLSLAHALWNLAGIWIYLLIRACLVKSHDREKWVLVGVNVAVGLLNAALLGGLVYTTVTDEAFRRAMTYDRELVEQNIERQVNHDVGKSVTVVCPEAPPVGTGQSFECDIMNSAGRTVAIAEVRWDDNFGTYSWMVREGSASLDGST